MCEVKLHVSVARECLWLLISGVVFEAYSPLGSPASFDAGEVPNILEDEIIKDLATKHHATKAQVMVAS